VLKLEEFRIVYTRYIIPVVVNNAQFLNIAPEGMADPKVDSVAEIFKTDVRPVGTEPERIQRNAITTEQQGVHKLDELSLAGESPRRRR
jgi:hypothetical protein